MFICVFAFGGIVGRGMCGNALKMALNGVIHLIILLNEFFAV